MALTMTLTDVKCRNAAAQDKTYQLDDRDGLHLQVSKTGKKYWRLRYSSKGKQKLVSIGQYPSIGLLEARNLAKEMRSGKNPEPPPSITFEFIARQWHATNILRWKPHHAEEVLESLTRWVFPEIGSIAPDKLTAPMVLSVLRVIEARPAVDTAHRVQQRISAALVFGIASGQCTTNPAALIGSALAPVIKRHRPAVLELDDARTMLEKAEGVAAHPVTRIALRVLALAAVRPGELRHARWDEFEALDGKAPVWRIPAERMKMRREHAVPLAPASVEALAVLRQLTGAGPLAFPGAWNAHKPMSDAALGSLLHRAGYQGSHVPHGWRSTFSTVMNERYPADRAVIDLMLAHLPPGTVEAAYNRASHFERRRQIAEIWARLLMKDLQSPEQLLNLARR